MTAGTTIALVLDEHEGVEELVPGQREREDRRGDEAGGGEGQEHADEGGGAGGAVDERGLLELVGQRLEEADQEPGAEGDGEGRVGEEQGAEVVGGASPPRTCAA